MIDLLKEFKGLSSAEAGERLKKIGPNELPSGQGRDSRQIMFDILKEPMLFLLVAGGIIYLLLGDAGEALLLLGFVFVVIGITFYQEHKTERSLTALRNLSSPQALVVRDGEQCVIPGREVTVGDLLIIKEGDRVPADCLLLAGNNLIVDESLLTGESTPAAKAPAGHTPKELARPGGELTPFLYSGSLIVDGQGLARVKTVGSQTEIGRIGQALETIESRETKLQSEVKRIVKIFFVVALLLVTAVILLTALYQHNWLNGLLSGITLAMAILPEELPVVLTIFLAVGAWRLSQKKVLARKIAAVEMLGTTSVLCVDKTGTLTLNQMSVKKLSAGGAVISVENEMLTGLAPKFNQLLEYAALACRPITFDPMEQAIKQSAGVLPKGGLAHQNWSFEREYPLSKKLLATSNVWQSPDGTRSLIAAKGAPEAIIDLCHLDQEKKHRLEQEIEALAEQGLRVLGVARADFLGKNYHASQHDYQFHFLGFVGLADPIRATAPAAIAECAEAGIRVIMITGDYPSTARQIAGQVGLASEKIVVGAELAGMSAGQLHQQIKTTNVFARMIPEQKLLIIDALKQSSEIVAMTGDGVNDAPALKAADIGVAMGEKGTDVAREAADLVLLNNDFSHLVAAIRLGRKIFDNLKKAVAYTVSIHLPIAGATLVPLLFGWPPILFPIHIVFLELIIDPACSVVFESEAEEKNIMKRPPRNPNEPLFSGRMLWTSSLQGLFSLSLIIATFTLALRTGHDQAEARTLAFIAMVFLNLLLILANRSWTKNLAKSLATRNRAFNWISAGTIAFLALVIYQPFMRTIFHFQIISAIDFLLLIGVGLLGLAWFELTEHLFKQKL